jgi:adenylate cyclase
MPRKTLTAFAIALLASALAVGLRDSGPMKRLEYPSWDMRVRALAKPTPATAKIKTILLDQDSLDWGKSSFGWSWPWPREVYAPIIAFARRGGAKVIAFDVLFLEPSAYGVHDDAALGMAFGQGDDVIGAVFLGDTTGDRVKWPDSFPDVDHYLGMGEGARDNASGVPAVLQRARMAAPIDEVATNAVLLANVHDTPDADGIFRRASLITYLRDQAVPSLGAGMYALGERTNATKQALLRFDDAGQLVGFANAPGDKAQRSILRYRGPSQTHEAYNAAAVIRSEMAFLEGRDDAPVDPEVFKDSYVLVGFTAPGLMDLRPSPISRVYPGVEVHATALDNLLSDDFLTDAGTIHFGLFCVLSSFLVGLLMLHCRRAWHSVVLFVCTLPLPVIIGMLVYVSPGLWWPVVPHTLAVIIALVGAIVVNYATEGRQKAFIKQAFKHYLSPDVIERIIDDPGLLELGGERRELTIFFSDLQGFSAFSEKLDPIQLTALLNAYLSEMTDIIHDEGGTLDKYEGDAIIAFWNAPLDQEDHAQRACRAAVRCQERLTEIRADYQQQYDAELHMRIGINTGPVVVGNMGSRERFDYTVLGDAANLASRLEGANKLFKTWIMVSEATWQKAGADLGGRYLGALRVVGRSAPVRVYELMAMQSGSDVSESSDFGRALDALGAGDLAQAAQTFATCDGDPAALRYAAYCNDWITRGEAWDGVWDMTEK